MTSLIIELIAAVMLGMATGCMIDAWMPGNKLYFP